MHVHIWHVKKTNTSVLTKNAYIGMSVSFSLDIVALEAFVKRSMGNLFY